MMWFAYAMVWVSTAAAVSYGIYYTGSPSCLWALFIPLFVTLTTSRETGNGKTKGKIK